MVESNLDFNEKQNNYLIGVVERLLYDNLDNLYKVAIVKIKDTDIKWTEKEIVVVGNFVNLKLNETYRFIGNKVSHKIYGEQFKVTSYELKALTTKSGLIAYLSSDRFKGIGEKTATKIVDYLGSKVIEKILNDEKVLDNIGLSISQKTNLIDSIRDNLGLEKTFVKLNTLGFSGPIADKIYGLYHKDALKVINENPYILANDISGISFKLTDSMAEKLGFESNDFRRLQGAIIQTMQSICFENGDTYADLKTLIEKSLELLETSRNNVISPNEIADQIIELSRQGKIIPDGSNIYLKSMYFSEYRISKSLKRLIDSSNTDISLKLDEEILKIENELNIKYGKEQVEAIKRAMNASVFLLSGGPGTGKTTIIKGIISLFLKIYGKDSKVLLVAPTGRAAKRMAEVTGRNASTIHRLLGLNVSLDSEETNEIKGDLLIVDETSMVDNELLDILLQSIPKNMKVIFVGDMNQLPSVGPGKIFTDMLESKVIEKTELKQIFRQSRESSIISLAQNIRKGELPKDFMEKKHDRSYISRNISQIPKTISQIVSIALKKGISADNIQILAPMYKSKAGIDNLNIVVQELLNPKKDVKKEVIFGNNVFRIGDRLLQQVNNPELNIYNGDVGKIKGISLAKDEDNEDNADKLIVDFDGNEVSILKKDWINLRLAYCMSIHKAQGGEFKTVILPMVPQFSRMFARNLLYTAVTRAKDNLILVGDYKSFFNCAHEKSFLRHTTLKKRLLEIFKKDQKSNFLTNEMIESEEINPMIGMDNITPNQFLDK